MSRKSGTGETQIQIDKRLLRDRMTLLRAKLEQVRTHRANYRSRRASTGVPVVALCGYTNAGKSTLLNALSGAEVRERALIACMCFVREPHDFCALPETPRCDLHS